MRAPRVVDVELEELDWVSAARSLLASNHPHDVATGRQLVRDQSEWLRLSSGDKWTPEIIPALREQSIHDLLLEDPISSRSFQKLRGYPGDDATLLDLIYGRNEALPLIQKANVRGRAMAAFGMQSPVARAFRNRLFAIACEIDNMAARCGPAFSCLSISCGHLREAELSQAIMSRSFSRFVAMDQDAGSIQHASAAYGHLGIDFLPSGLKPILKGKLARKHGFDFIYAAGLFDYIEQPFAIPITRATFNFLKPGGKLWVTNFLPNIIDRGFMECFMDWWLIYRSEGEIAELTSGIDPALIAQQKVLVETEQNIGFLEVQRA